MQPNVTLLFKRGRALPLRWHPGNMLVGWHLDFLWVMSVIKLSSIVRTNLIYSCIRKSETVPKSFCFPLPEEQRLCCEVLGTKGPKLLAHCWRFVTWRACMHTWCLAIRAKNKFCNTRSTLALALDPCPPPQQKKPGKWCSSERQFPSLEARMIHCVNPQKCTASLYQHFNNCGFLTMPESKEKQKFDRKWRRRHPFLCSSQTFTELWLAQFEFLGLANEICCYSLLLVPDWRPGMIPDAEEEEVNKDRWAGLGTGHIWRRLWVLNVGVACCVRLNRDMNWECAVDVEAVEHMDSLCMRGGWLGGHVTLYFISDLSQ